MIFLETVDSTNAYVKRHSRAFADGEAVLARAQTAGRGRLGRSWISEAGGLFLSVFLREVPALLPFRSALAVRDALSDQPEIRFKWPNDLLLPENDQFRKVCGILCEGFADGAVVGVGVNLRFSGERPVPHAACLPTEYDPKALAERITSNLLLLRDEPNDRIMERYQPLCATLGRNVILPNGEWGTAYGLENGCLLVRTEKGNVRVGSGEVVVQDIY